MELFTSRRHNSANHGENFHPVGLELVKNRNLFSLEATCLKLYMKRYASHSSHFMEKCFLIKCWRQQNNAKNDDFCGKRFIQLLSKGTLCINNPLHFQSIIVYMSMQYIMYI